MTEKERTATSPSWYQRHGAHGDPLRGPGQAPPPHSMVGRFPEEGAPVSLVVQPSARETFTPHEIATAYRDFTESGPQYVDEGSGLKASAYRFGTRVLIAYEEAESGAVLFAHPRSPERMSFRSIGSRIAAYLDLDARLKYFRNVRSSWLVYRVYR